MEPLLTSEELAELEDLAPEQRAAALEALEQRLRAALDDDADPA
jgi:hypothetical protein